MKLSHWSKVISAGVIATSLAILPSTIPAQAQTQNTAPNTDTRSTTTDTRTTGDVRSVQTEDDFDWGWLGLLGLAGLAGLIPRKRQETVYRSDNDPNVVVNPRSDYR